MTFLVLELAQHVFEGIVIKAEHHVRVHLDETAIAVIGKALVTGTRRKALNRLVVEAEIQHGIHHAGHGYAGSRAHRNEQRIGLVAKAGADLAASPI